MSGGFKHTMADPQFGKLVPDDFPTDRDAIHIATVAVIAHEDLVPGTHVGFPTKEADVMGASEIAPVGIVDPFLTTTVKKGERFWVFLYPGTVTSLRHNWTHPAFDVRSQLIRAMEETPAKRRMKEFAAQLNSDAGEDDGYGGTYEPVTFEELISRATAHVQSGDYWSEGGRFEGQSLYDEFWDDFEQLTGIKVKDDDRYSFFSCSC
jgi:hypothetical protein